VLILAVLADGPCHGYQLALEIEGRSGGGFSIKHGTLYPILREMEAVGHINGSWASASGRRRRIYALSPTGRNHLDRLRRAWKDFSRRLGTVVHKDTG
jgi:DNA-binding PadR family transcriptional regulator